MRICTMFNSSLMSGYVNLTGTTLTPDQQDLLNMGLNCHYMTKPKPHRKRLEMEILLGDIHQLEKNGKITTSTALQPTLLAEAAKTRGVYNSKLLNKNHFLASKQLRDNPDIIIRRFGDNTVSDDLLTIAAS
ncbi:hypothetical protein Pcinc_009602 [Petrolisthes cinctipes]|uniref:Uncharacterized protein n=1 Tax=Petrolisthes cinctipes TaxID=88211 RepID=A0AAE1GAW1_PETCI|nr:hypothetical protein Pcinc_009602 [Petrolisthes cinctipes]